MALEGLTETLKEKWAEALAQIQESSAFNTVREKFESQSPTAQRAIMTGGILLAVLFVFSFPLGYLSTSSDNMTTFEENRSLIQGLLKASRSAKEAPPLPPPTDAGALRSMIERMLHDKKLAPEQIGDMATIPGVPSKLAPTVVTQNGVAAQIKQLNLSQIVDISNSIGNLAPGTKLIGLDIVASGATPASAASHYYDINIRVVNFGLAPISFDTGDKGGGSKSKGKPGRRNGGKDSEAPPPKSEDEE